VGNTYDAYGGIRELAGQKTGFFHLEQLRGRTWFVTPEGHAFFPVSISHPYSSDSKQTVRVLYDGDQRRWMRDWFAKMAAMGFNAALAGGTSTCRNLSGYVDSDLAEETFDENHFPYTTGVWLIPHPVELRKGEERADVFTAAYQDLIEERAERACVRHRDNPLLIGYYYGFGPFGRTPRWVNSLLSSAPGSPGREAIVDLLIARHNGDVKRFSAVHGTTLDRIDDLKCDQVLAFSDDLDKTRATRWTQFPADRADFDAITRLVAERIHQVAHRAIRCRDTNHLILGMYVKEQSFSYETWRTLAPYIDVAAPQHCNPGLDFGIIAEQTGKPVLVSDQEWGKLREGRAPSVRTVDDKGLLYELLMERLIRDPAVCGINFCSTIYDLVTGVPRLVNKVLSGFYDQQGNPRQTLIDACTKINDSIYTYALDPATQTEADRLNQAYAQQEVAIKQEACAAWHASTKDGG
jgi:hypothetical protein